ncbi:MAG: ABC transporter permease, partial [Candidatus Dormibacteraeota bacterium]|nr:ABC transporter permease [Candidatus Dormibacteraeota bacterium]
LVLGNLVVVVAITAVQLAVLVVLAAIRGATFDITAAGLAWFVGAVLLFTIGMYGIAEAMASRIGRQEEFISATPAVAIVPWFFAGSLFPISVLPGFLDVFAKFLPLTHALAVVRYGLMGARASGLTNIWGMSNPTAMAALSLGVVAVFAVLGVTLAVRTFSKAAVH